MVASILRIREISVTSAGDFYVVYLVQASASPEKVGDGFEAQTIKPVCLRALPAHKPILLGAFRSSRRSFPLSRDRWRFCAETAKAPAARRRAPGLDTMAPALFSPLTALRLPESNSRDHHGRSFTTLFRKASSISIHHPLQGSEPSIDNHSSSRSHEAHPIQDASSAVGVDVARQWRH